MRIKGPDREALQRWLIQHLEPLSETNPNVLSRFVLQLLEAEGTSDKEKREDVLRELNLYLAESTGEFVDALFAAIKTGTFRHVDKARTRTPSVDSEEYGRHRRRRGRDDRESSSEERDNREQYSDVEHGQTSRPQDQEEFDEDEGRNDDRSEERERRRSEERRAQYEPEDLESREEEYSGRGRRRAREEEEEEEQSDRPRGRRRSRSRSGGSEGRRGYERGYEGRSSRGGKGARGYNDRGFVPRGGGPGRFGGRLENGFMGRGGGFAFPPPPAPGPMMHNGPLPLPGPMELAGGNTLAPRGGSRGPLRPPGPPGFVNNFSGGGPGPPPFPAEPFVDMGGPFPGGRGRGDFGFRGRGRGGRGGREGRGLPGRGVGEMPPFGGGEAEGMGDGQGHPPPPEFVNSLGGSPFRIVDGPRYMMGGRGEGGGVDDFGFERLMAASHAAAAFESSRGDHERGRVRKRSADRMLLNTPPSSAGAPGGANAAAAVHAGMAVGHSPERPVHKRHAAFPPPRGPVMPAPPLIPNMAQQQQEPPDFFPHLPPSGFPLLGPVNGDLVPMEDISTLIFTLIPPSVLPEHIGRHCRRFGPVLELQLGPANVSLPNGVPAQNAYVQFYARQDAEACLMNPDPILHNRFISVAWHMTNLLPKYSEEPTLSHHAGPPGRRPSVVHVVGGPNNDQQQPLPPSSRPPAPRSRSPPAPYERGRRAHPNPQAPLHYQQHHLQTPTSHRSFQPQHQQQQPRPHAPLQFLPLHSCDNTSSFRPPARPAPARNSGPPQSRQPSFALQPPRHQPHHGHQHQHQHQQQPSNHGPPASQTRSHPQPQRSQEPTGPPHPTAPSHPKPHTLPDRTSIPPAPISSQHAPPLPTNKAIPSPQTLQHTREELLKRQFDISRQKETLFTKQVIARRKLVKSLEAKSGTPSDDLSKAKADLEGAELALLEAKREVGNMAGKLKQGETVTSLSQGPGFGGPGRGGGGGGGSAVSSRPRGPMRLDLRPTALKLSSPPQQVPETSLRSFFSNFGQVEHLEKKQGAVVIKYANRRMAENAKNEAKFLGDLPLHLDWYDVRVEGEAGTGELDVRELDEALGLRDGNGLGQRGRGAPFGGSGRGRRGGR